MISNKVTPEESQEHEKKIEMCIRKDSETLIRRIVGFIPGGLMNISIILSTTARSIRCGTTKKVTLNIDVSDADYESKGEIK